MRAQIKLIEVKGQKQGGTGLALLSAGWLNPSRWTMSSPGLLLGRTEAAKMDAEEAAGM